MGRPVRVFGDRRGEVPCIGLTDLCIGRWMLTKAATACTRPLCCA